MKHFYFILISLVLISCIQEPESNSLGGYITDEEIFNELMDTSDLHKIESIFTDTLESYDTKLINKQ
jgi:hypothetical protein